MQQYILEVYPGNHDIDCMSLQDPSWRWTSQVKTKVVIMDKILYSTEHRATPHDPENELHVLLLVTDSCLPESYGVMERI